MKKYEIIYTPLLTTAEVLKEPYDATDYECRPNITSIVSNGNIFRDKKVSVIVEAPTKKVAEALFAITIYQQYMCLGINGGWTPLVVDAVRNILSVTEVSEDE